MNINFSAASQDIVIEEAGYIPSDLFAADWSMAVWIRKGDKADDGWDAYCEALVKRGYKLIWQRPDDLMDFKTRIAN